MMLKRICKTEWRKNIYLVAAELLYSVGCHCSRSSSFDADSGNCKVYTWRFGYKAE